MFYNKPKPTKTILRMWSRTNYGGRLSFIMLIASEHGLYGCGLVSYVDLLFKEHMWCYLDMDWFFDVDIFGMWSYFVIWVGGFE